MKTYNHYVPQIHLRTDLIAGESEAACQSKLQRLTHQLEKKCSRRVKTPAPGYAPYLETEMQPWQAGNV
jgi:hypothetical protein